VTRWRLRAEQRRPRLSGVEHGSSTLEELLGYLRDVGLTHVDGLWKHGADALDHAEWAVRTEVGRRIPCSERVIAAPGPA
jgi:hypothetical protein